MIEAFLKKQGKSQVSNLNYHLNEFEKKKKKRPKISRVSRRKEILKLREEINKVEIKKKIERINKIKNRFA